MDREEQSGETVSPAMIQTMQETFTGQKRKPLSMDDVIAMLVGQIG